MKSAFTEAYRRRRDIVPAAAALLLLLFHTSVAAQSLRGSSHSLDIQNRMARQHDFTYIATTGQLQRFVAGGYLVPIRGNHDFQLDNEVSFAYARGEVRTFLRRLGSQYRSACGQQLVVTSLTRPKSRQPRNASSDSVHPTGMALDLRRSRHAKCRAWLERVLLSLERQGVLEATREYYPPHYHVALFPQPYTRYVARLRDEDQAPTAGKDIAREYTVESGDSLWTIARAAGVSVADIRAANGLASSRIHPGQRLRIPASGTQMAGGSAYDYRVQRGDSLWEIARTHSTSVERLRAENGLNTNRIRPGQILTVPGGG
ncbi:MAG TPA: DUF5715 family protein [Arenicellales bacterium]|nr:DUF5715 family protein [Arenicellales bacterium]